MDANIEGGCGGRMLEDWNKVKAMWRHWGLTPNIQEYTWRFAIQKFTYLAQILGMPTHYCFDLYLKGPYSPGLTQDYYGNERAIEDLHIRGKLTLPEKQILAKIQETVLGESVVTWEGINGKMNLLESLATVVFLVMNREQISDEEIFAGVKNLKPYLSDTTIVLGRNKAKELLFKQEYMTPELKQELDEWDKIDEE